MSDNKERRPGSPPSHQRSELNQSLPNSNLIAVRSQVVGSRDEPFEVLKLPALLDGPTEIDWLVENIIPPGTAGLLAGDSGVGKTWLALDLALAIVTGTPWLDRFETRQGTVLIVDKENSDLLLRVRLLSLLKGRGISKDDAAGLMQYPGLLYLHRPA